MKTFLMILLPAYLPIAVSGQFVRPNSAEFDPLYGYIVSYENGAVGRQWGSFSSDAQMGAWVSWHPWGVELMDGAVFSAGDHVVVKHELSPYFPMLDSITVWPALFRYLANDGNYLYSVDYIGHRIFRFDFDTHEATDLTGPLSFAPTGLCYDAMNDRLLTLVYDQPSSALWSIDPASGQATLITPLPGLGCTGGLTVDCAGRIYAACGGDIYLIGDGALPMALGLGVWCGCSENDEFADISFDSENEQLLLPNPGSELLCFRPVSCIAGIDGGSPGRSTIWPNPCDRDLHVGQAGVSYVVLDGIGKRVGSGVTGTAGIVNTSALTPGQYVIEVRDEDPRRSRFAVMH